MPFNFIQGVVEGTLGEIRNVFYCHHTECEGLQSVITRHRHAHPNYSARLWLSHYRCRARGVSLLLGAHIMLGDPHDSDNTYHLLELPSTHCSLFCAARSTSTTCRKYWDLVCFALCWLLRKQHKDKVLKNNVCAYLLVLLPSTTTRTHNYYFSHHIVKMN